MARFAVSGRATIAGTAVLPLVSLYATAACHPEVVEIGCWNTTSTAVTVSVNRLVSAATQGAGLTEVPETDPDMVAVATAFAGHTGGTPAGGELRRATLGAAVGSGVIWTFKRLTIDNSTADGV